MDKQELAINYIKHFCNGDIEKLKDLLTTDFKLDGPLFKFQSRDLYITSLLNDPPEQGNFKVISITENQHQISVIYHYIKTSFTVTIAQLFTIKNNLISETMLVFDTKRPA